MNDCSNCPFPSTNVTGAIKHFTQAQQVNDCDSRYDDGWNKYSHIGLAKHPVPAASYPGISGTRTEIESLNTSSILHTHIHRHMDIIHGMRLFLILNTTISNLHI